MPTLKTAEPGTFSRITGIGAYRAENLVTNDDIAGPINSSDEWIRQRTGIITSTVTSPYFPPAAASALTDRLGTGPVPAWDISAACAGYCYGISQADALVRAGTMDNVLVIGAEKLSDIIDPEDRSISFIL